ncbi:phage portal protein [Bacillus toyonensis]|uniref:Phage portal protein n=1 Tax=Bacillus toyonensis TaxID=155322 RepID=A0A2B5SKY0_9BACI|nr:phage portal protein [Bacillus toyonensis]PEA65640.1 phage portal protein [Bacillus toyonensis]PEE80632.1 phage portal protein [Bacillus toyonensis]PEL23088.1 phage portal protein [Bacillus toyonensis]PFY60538.1 phage portal protein [Bacillus toyonensis]PGA35706.1 phage portal protein [Bacillus toyonensis]
MIDKKTMKNVKVFGISKAADDPKNKEDNSKQMAVDPFAQIYGDKGLVKPPYDMKVLMDIKESNPIHSACISAKVDDIAGVGFDFAPFEEVKEAASQEQYEMLKNFMRKCNPEMTSSEILRAVWEDYETVGWGIIEVVRDNKGESPVELYHIPGHTVRAHKDKIRFAQIVNNKEIWFKKFNYPDDYHLADGRPLGADDPAGNGTEKAGEVIVIRKFGSRSSYYGIPNYVSSIGSIVGSQAARDYNIDFFTGKTIPDSILFLEGVDEVDSGTENELKAFFSAETKGEHHKLAVVPVPDGAKARLEKISPDVKEGSFRLYKQDSAMEICVAHRVPPYRIGWAMTGSLGQTTAKEMNEMYKRSIIEPGQEILEHRLNNQLFRVFAEILGSLDWHFKLNEIDTGDREADLKYAKDSYEGGILKLNESRKVVGYEPVPEGDKFFDGKTESSPPEPIAKAADNEQENIIAINTFREKHEEVEKSMQKRVTDFFPNRENGS